MRHSEQDLLGAEDIDLALEGAVTVGRSHKWVHGNRKRVWRPPTDVYETDSHVVVRVEVAGLREEDFRISVADRRLVIGGLRRDPSEKLAYQQMEINYGEFQTEVYLPSWAVDQDNIEAVYEEGFLSVRLPKKRETRVPITVVR